MGTCRRSTSLSIALTEPCTQHQPPPPLQERALCATERYLPAQYLAVKAALLRVQDVKGHVSRADVAQLPFKVRSRPACYARCAVRGCRESAG